MGVEDQAGSRAHRGTQGKPKKHLIAASPGRSAALASWTYEGIICMFAIPRAVFPSVARRIEMFEAIASQARAPSGHRSKALGIPQPILGNTSLSLTGRSLSAGCQASRNNRQPTGHFTPTRIQGLRAPELVSARPASAAARVEQLHRAAPARITDKLESSLARMPTGHPARVRHGHSCAARSPDFNHPNTMTGAVHGRRSAHPATPSHVRNHAQQMSARETRHAPRTAAVAPRQAFLTLCRNLGIHPDRMSIRELQEESDKYHFMLHGEAMARLAMPSVEAKLRCLAQGMSMEALRRPGFWNNDVMDAVVPNVVKCDAWPAGMPLRIIDHDSGSIHFYSRDGSEWSYPNRNTAWRGPQLNPSLGEVTLIRQNNHFMMLDRGTKLYDVPRDGDCFFSSISMALGYAESKRHAENWRLRDSVARYIESDPQLLEIATAPVIPIKSGKKPGAA